MDSDGMLGASGITILTATTWDHFEKGQSPARLTAIPEWPHGDRHNCDGP